MSRPRFFETLDILPAADDDERKAMQAAGLDPGLALSVCAMGPVAPGEEILAMRVWLWQQLDDGRVAASAGKGGVHLGGHPLVAEQEHFPPTANRWMIQTQLEKHSPQFVEGKPALATGMALVRRDGALEIEHWSSGVLIGEHEPHHG
jgi:hypothetical protein